MVNYFNDTIFSRSCYYGEGEVHLVKTNYGRITFYCIEEDSSTIIVLDKDEALELATSIIESYKGD